MARNRTLGLTWLTDTDQAQRIWAVNYLRSKGVSTSHERPGDHSHTDMLEIGDRLEREIQEQTYEGPRCELILRGMRDAWRQRRYRNRTDGLQICEFKIQKATKERLAELAQEKGISEGDFLDSIIKRAYDAMQLRIIKSSDTEEKKAGREKPKELLEIHNSLNPDDPVNSNAELAMKTRNNPPELTTQEPPLEQPTYSDPNTPKNYFPMEIKGTVIEDPERPKDLPAADDNDDPDIRNNEQEDSTDQGSPEIGPIKTSSISDTIMDRMSSQTRVKPNILK